MTKFSDFFASEWQKAQPQEAPVLKAWSYSRLAKYEECPRAVFYTYIEKRGPGEKSPAMLRGLAAHDECARIYRGEPPKPGDNIVTREWRECLTKQHKMWFPDIEAELQVAYTSAWENRKWFDNDVAFRCAFDGFAYKSGSDVVIYEHKTGRPRESYVQQAELYACVAHKMHPEAALVHVHIQYLDLPVRRGPDVHLWSAAELMVGHEGRPLLKKWEEKAQRMLADRDFPMRAGPQCRYCQFRGEAGGPCVIFS